MEEPPAVDSHCPPPIYPDHAEPLAIPPVDEAMFNFDFSFPEDFSGSGFTFDDYNDINLDDFEITEDIFLDPTADANSGSYDRVNLDHLHPFPSSQPPVPNSDHNSFSEILPIDSSDLGSSGQSGDVLGVSNSENKLGTGAPRVYDRLSPQHDINGDKGSTGAIRGLKFDNWDLNGSMGSNNRSAGRVSSSELDHSSPDSVSCINLSPHRSGDWNSHPPRGEKSSSSGSHEGVSETSNSYKEKPYKKKPNNAWSYSNNGPAGCELKTENTGPRKAIKRKKKEDGDSVSHYCDSRKSSLALQSTNGDANEAIIIGSEGEEDGKKKARLMKNRESAQLSRERKKQYVAELEGKVKYLHSTITDLNSRISYIMAENAALRQQLSGVGMYPPPNPGMFPMAPMGYPWAPYPPYMVNPQGSNVPLLPIPRIKPQRPDPAPKASRKTEKPMASKKSERKTKKVASVSFLGLLFFFLLFAGLVPMVNVKYGLRIGETASMSSMLSSSHKGRVLMVDNDSSKSENERERDIVHGIRSAEEHVSPSKACDNWSYAGGNSSEPLVASLYVPRNNKLVQMDGNIIIHSVLASERALVSGNMGEQVKKGEETSLAIPRNRVPVHHVAGSPRAIGYVPGDNLKSTGTEGSLQQWFHAGLEGPLLSSGLCTKVYEFDVTPSPGSIVPVTSMPNSSNFVRKNATEVNRSKNRKVLRGHVIPVHNHDREVGKEYNTGPNAQGVGLEGNKSSNSAIVVSVLVDPRDADHVDGETMISSQSQTLSRIFVVLLVDGVKYITYSCVLPRMGSSPHLVRA